MKRLELELSSFDWIIECSRFSWITWNLQEPWGRAQIWQYWTQRAQDIGSVDQSGSPGIEHQYLKADKLNVMHANCWTITSFLSFNLCMSVGLMVVSPYRSISPLCLPASKTGSPASLSGAIQASAMLAQKPDLYDCLKPGSWKGTENLTSSL